MEESIIQQRKVCFKCGVIKPLSYFYRHGQMNGGRVNKCKECTKEDVRANRAKNIERIRAYDRERGKTEKRIAENTKRARVYRGNNKPIYDAHKMLNNMRRTGAIVSKPCAVCGTTDRIESHHFDYSKPLEVVWLCSEHHKAVHYPKIAPRVKQIA